MANHTDIPWTVNSQSILGNRHDGNTLIASCVHFGNIGMANEQKSQLESKANAKYIVKAVNNFESLLSALKGMTAQFRKDYPRLSASQTYFEYEAAIEAIAAAETH